MTVKEIMERVGTTQTGRALAYIKDGLDEIARSIDDNVQSTTVDIVKDTRDYDFPTTMVKLRKIFAKDAESNFRQIPRMTHGPYVEK